MNAPDDLESSWPTDDDIAGSWTEPKLTNSLQGTVLESPGEPVDLPPWLCGRPQGYSWRAVGQLTLPTRLQQARASAAGWLARTKARAAGWLEASRTELKMALEHRWRLGPADLLAMFAGALLLGLLLGWCGGYVVGYKSALVWIQQ